MREEDFLYEDLEDFELSAGFKTKESFREGFRMARIRKSTIGVGVEDEEEYHKDSPDVVDELFVLVKIVEQAIESGDWKVDGRCDPTMLLNRIKFKYLGMFKKIEESENQLAEWA